MKKINTLIILMSIVLLSSCNGFLDVKPSNSAASEISITNVNDAGVAINGLMSKMASSSYYGRDFVMYGDAKGGDFAISSQGRGLDGLYTFNHSATSGSYSGYWNQIYHNILQANNIILNINKLESDGKGSAALNSYKGQALTARALMYFDLVRLYGKPYNMDKASFGVPLVLEPLDAASQPTRSSVEQVYTQILQDLKDAEPLISKTNSKGYLNYYANLAIQGRVYLHMDKFDEALTVAETIINDKKYTLYTNPQWVPSWSLENGSESIFVLSVYVAEGDLKTASLGYYLLRQGKITGAMGWFMASDYYLSRLGQDPSDVRWGIMDYDESSKTRFGSCLKYSGVDLKGDKASTSAVNIKVIRLSEVYLMAAEAALRKASPDKVKAVTYLNAIRKRSPTLAPAEVANITVDMVIDERSKELFAEGHRYFDMLRLNRTIEFNDDFISPAVTIIHRTKTINRTFYKTILPISQAEMDSNPAIVPQQNPGY